MMMMMIRYLTVGAWAREQVLDRSPLRRTGGKRGARFLVNKSHIGENIFSLPEVDRCQE